LPLKDEGGITTKKLLAGTAALLVLAVPPVASARMIDAGSAGYRAASSTTTRRAYATPQANLQARGSGTGSSCGAGCTAVSGTYSSSLISGTFRGTLNQVTSPSPGCNGVQGILTLYTGADSVLLGITGTTCGGHFSGDYTVNDGTGAYQENSMGWGGIAAVSASPGAFWFTASGAFYPNIARQTGVDYGSPQ
jgi:hypothetical protein